MVWTASRSGVFSVKSLYSTLEPGGSALFPYVGIWRACVPPKVAFFAWEASWGKILTLDQLQRRGYSLANRCFLCLAEAETVDHLLLHCVMTRALWNLLFSLFGVEWVLSETEDAEEDEDGALALAYATEKALQVRDKHPNSLIKGTAKSGGEFFAARSYHGLEMHSNDSSPEPYLIGRAGKASGYEGEKGKENF
ncbi:hypothetical protein CK203_092982 [Vitis vinifera]|uniref:Reverse transcriptase zinc-binding domain-containing protein n=1 Tax=Vitis vinifera TaxID=29760 RepID=A0A438DFU3_VITVI|nr:hypothetical protein CK203_092982 [Vitis vinifera]